MESVKITEWIDIHAPREEVFDLIINIERRMQLSPLWGIAKIENPSMDYPQEGSSYDVQIQANQGSCFETVITNYKPLKKLAYKSLQNNHANVTWNLQDVKNGTRLIYTEEFVVDDDQKEELRQSVQKIVHDWLKNMQRYAELRGAWTKCLAKKLVDRFYLGQMPAQRKTITTILFMQAISAITFLMAALALGVASLFS